MRTINSCIVMLVLFSISASTGASIPLQNAEHPQGFLYAEGEYLMLDGQAFIIKGFNYFPRDYGWTSITDWDWAAVDRELALAALQNANTIRTGIGYLAGTGNPSGMKNIFTHNQVTPEYLAAMDKFLSLADQHGLKVIFWLNEAMPFELYDPANFDSLQRFLESVIPQFADDRRIAAWDLATDLDGTLLLPPPNGGYGEISWMNRDSMVAFLQKMAEVVKALDPNHPLAVGFCWPSSSLLVQDFTDFLFFQFLGGDYPQVLENQGATGEMEDYVGGVNTTEGFEAVADRLEAKLSSIQAQLKRPMPIVPSEYGIYSGGDSSETMQSTIYQAVLEVVFIRLQLAGALNWALTDFIWPPKAYTIVPMDAPMSTIYEQAYGAFRLDYSPKPAAEIAGAYYAGSPTLTFQTRPEELRFDFSKTFVPGSDDTRLLAVAFDRIDFLGENDKVLQTIDIGAPSARPYLANGFFEDEGPWEQQAANFAWAGGEASRATVRLPFPEGTRSLQMHILSGVEGMEVDILVDGEQVQTISPSIEWETYTIDLPAVKPLQAGDLFLVRGRFNIPVSGGTATVQTGTDGQNWSEAGSAVPQAGRFVVSIPAQAGSNDLRLQWNGTGLYGPAMSDILTYEAAAAPDPTPTSSLSSETSATPTPLAPVPAYRASMILSSILVVFGLLLVGVIVIWVVRKKHRGSDSR